MNIDEFIKEYEGKTVGYPKNMYVGECLSLVKWYIKEVFNIDPPPSGCGAARCYWTKFPSPLDTVFEKIPYVRGLVPKKGWIAVWNKKAGKGYGHISIVLDASTFKFTSLDQNWGGRKAHKVSHYYKNIYGFLAPKNTDYKNDKKEEDTMSNCDKERLARDRYWNATNKILKSLNISNINEKNYDEKIDEALIIISKLWQDSKTLIGIRGEVTKKQNKIEELEKIIASSQSVKGELSLAESKKWLLNTLIFSAPVLIAQLTALSGQIPQEAAWGVLVIFIINIAIDLLRKVMAGNSSQKKAINQ